MSTSRLEGHIYYKVVGLKSSVRVFSEVSRWIIIQIVSFDGEYSRGSLCVKYSAINMIFGNTFCILFLS